MAAIIYLRVSTDDQRLGPEAQRAACLAYCERVGLTVAGEHADHGVSGAAALDSRLGLMAAVGELDEGDVLVVAKRDRLARDTMAAAMIERMVERAGARIETADGVGNGDSPEAQLMRRMIDAFAEYERAVIRGRTRAALAAKKRRGERMGRPACGFKVEDGALVEDCDEQRILALVGELRCDGLSIRQLREALIARGVPCSHGRAQSLVKRVEAA